MPESEEKFKKRQDDYLRSVCEHVNSSCAKGTGLGNDAGVNMAEFEAERNEAMKDKKIFLTSFPSGELRMVEIIEKHPTIKNGWYIRYEHGGTDTTTECFLFDIPDALKKQCALYVDYAKDCQALKLRNTELAL